MSRPKSSGRSRDAATAGKPSSSRPSTAGPRETSSDISGTHRNTRSNEKIAQNWTAHNYDLAKLMQYHLEVINFPKPSAETTRWKTPVETVRYTKNIAKELLQQQLLEKNNINLSNRLTDIVSADRRFDTQEYSPGWRIGKGM